MLAEALVYARARLSGQANPYGHLSEQVAIWARHRRRGKDWAGHLARAKSLCLDAAEACPASARRTALVLGAGPLLDVPLSELSARFRRVVLADLAFLPKVRTQASALGNVDCIEADLSGCMRRLPDFAAHAPLPEAPAPDLSLGLADLDFAYSANLLSQLPLFALSALRRLSPELGQDALDRFAASMVRAHLSALRALPARACLVTDLVERGFGRGGPAYEKGLLFGETLELTGERWVWRMAPKGEATPGLDVEREVLGVANVRAGHVQPPPRGAP